MGKLLPDTCCFLWYLLPFVTINFVRYAQVYDKEKNIKYNTDYICTEKAFLM